MAYLVQLITLNVTFEKIIKTVNNMVDAIKPKDTEEG